jgi:hypothetical protein
VQAVYAEWEAQSYESLVAEIAALQLAPPQPFQARPPAD